MNEPEDYSFESLFRFGVDKEKSGFDQCRNRMIGYIDRRLEELGEVPRWDEENCGKQSAYRDMLAYLKGAKSSGHAEPDHPDTGTAS